MTNDLRLGPSFNLPLDTVLLKKAILAKTGVGKSNTAAAYVEESLDANIPVIVLDPKGDWYGLRSSADGKKAGYPVVVLGGDHADVDLEAAAGSLVAESLVESGASAVVDLSEFSKRQMLKFVADFTGAFYKAKKKAKSPCLLVIEEADEMAPQRLVNAYGPDMTLCLAGIERIVKRGRFLGIGTLVITQRSASLNKDVLTQSDMLIIMQTTAPQDVKAVDAWIEHHPDQDKRKEVLANIQSLDIGEGFVWCPALDLFERTKFRRRKTFDSGATPTIGELRVEPKVMATIDLDSLQQRMSALVEKARENDPATLKARIRSLEADLRKAEAAKPAPKTEVREVSVITDADRVLLERIVEASAQQGEILTRRVDELYGLMEKWRLVDGAARAAIAPAINGHVQQTRVKVVPTPRSPTPAINEPEPNGDFMPGPAQVRLLSALQELHDFGMNPVDKTQLALWAGYSAKSGGFNNYLGALRSAGLLEYPQPGTIAITAAGQQYAEAGGTPGIEELQARVYNKVGPAKAKILQHLTSVYPAAVTKADLADTLGYSHTSGGFNNYLGALRTLKLIDYPTPGYVQAQPVLFLEATT